MGRLVEPRRELTVDAWAALPEDAPGELLGGMLADEEQVGYLHDAVCAALLLLFGRWLDGRGRLATSDVRFAVAEDKGRKADLSVYFDRVKLPARGAVRTPPDVIVEVVSPTPADRRRARIEKLGDYAAFGVRFYWLVDPELRTLEVLELEEGTYRIALAASVGVHPIPGCEGLEVDLDRLWGEVSDLD